MNKERKTMKFRKRPVVIEAIQWNGLNFNEIKDFAGADVAILEEVRKPDMDSHVPGDYRLSIRTLEGVMEAKRGDYIIKGVNGEFYPCKPDIFEKTYEKAE